MECLKCYEISQKYLKENPDKKASILCDECYEKSLEFIVYVNLPFES